MGNKLLLADDSITIQKVVAIIFANEEFELTVVDNGVAALQKAREVRPDVMLVDALMPGKSGYEVCAELRRDPQLCTTPNLLLIGAFEPFDEEKARDCGADSSITKPFESQQLIDRVKELLELGKTRTAAPRSRRSCRSCRSCRSRSQGHSQRVRSRGTLGRPFLL
jgi:DNA-binding response OmpR family regulator